jgi:hypothetical protein
MIKLTRSDAVSILPRDRRPSLIRTSPGFRP